MSRHRGVCRVAEHELSRGAAHVLRNVLPLQQFSAKVVVVIEYAVASLHEQAFHCLDGSLGVAVRAW